MENAECFQHTCIPPAPCCTQLAGMLQRSVEVCVQPLTHPDSPSQSEANLPCPGRAQGHKHTTLASGPCWHAFANADGAMLMNTNQHSPCVMQLQLSTLRSKSKIVTRCCSQCIIYYLKKKRQVENPLHWLSKEILVVTILHRGKIQNKYTTIYLFRCRHLEMLLHLACTF